MTEDQAREKWCPFARIGISPNGDAYNSRCQDYHDTNCITSDCMAWRSQGMVDTQNTLKKVEPAERLGYCGLAGKP